MNKELIEKLREASYSASHGEMADLLQETADALEAKAAPVGERLVVTVVDPDCRTTTEHVITERDVILLWNRIDTLERQQAREVVMPELPPFAQKVISKLQRFQECAEDGEDTDIGRHWLDLLTQLALLNRVQRSPALWEISQQGDDVLARLNGKEVV